MNDSSGYVYILKNEAFQKSLFKIGFTKNMPEQRAKQLFNGMTGVPLPFDVVMACQVGNYQEAEKNVHARLKPYRVNRRREFFELPIEICSKVVLDECNKINEHLGLNYTNPVISEKKEDTVIEIEEYHRSGFILSIKDLLEQDSYNSTLTADQRNRVEILMLVFADVFPNDISRWYDGFMKDHNSEKKIQIWEALAKAFCKAKRYYEFNEYKQVVFDSLLLRTINRKTFVMKAMDSSNVPRDLLSRILDCYELKPTPLVVVTSRGKMLNAQLHINN
ncbi:TPA: GIY-YIG nuclease family protein [Citrobacter youngae]